MKKEILAVCLVILTISCGIVATKENSKVKDSTAVVLDSTKVTTDSLITKQDSIKK